VAGIGQLAHGNAASRSSTAISACTSQAGPVPQRRHHDAQQRQRRDGQRDERNGQQVGGKPHERQLVEEQQRQRRQAQRGGEPVALLQRHEELVAVGRASEPPLGHQLLQRGDAGGVQRDAVDLAALLLLAHQVVPGLEGRHVPDVQRQQVTAAERGVDAEGEEAAVACRRKNGTYSSEVLAALEGLGGGHAVLRGDRASLATGRSAYITVTIRILDGTRAAPWTNSGRSPGRWRSCSS
jgi:hypothetical protein